MEYTFLPLILYVLYIILRYLILFFLNYNLHIISLSYSVQMNEKIEISQEELSIIFLTERMLILLRVNIEENPLKLW